MAEKPAEAANDVLRTAARNGGGQFYSTTSERDLENALEDSLRRITTATYAFSKMFLALSDQTADIASIALVIGLQVKAEPKAQVTAEKENIDIKLYDIIYEAIADVKAAMEGLL